MSTKKLAKKLGLLRQRSQSSSESKESLLSNQTFSYLIVIDFESTCWREKNNYSQEIIEFPAVLLNTSTGEVESEFHTYVQPQEHPVLSEFCTELTGITQMQVEAGIPLQICLSRFSRWLQNLQLERGVAFPNKQPTCSAALPSQRLCTFLTWSDWDLGVCLQYECKRKQLHKPDVLNNWIDLRSTYRLFYNRKPKGLNGALQDLGIQFSGREHSGLDDARNTAQLAARMMRDGCVMKITRSLERTPPMVKSMFRKTGYPAENTKEKLKINKKENVPTSSKPLFKIPLKVCLKHPSPEVITRNSIMEDKSLSVKKSVQMCQSLVSPKTLLSGTTAPLCGHSSRSVPAQAAANLSSSLMINCTPSHRSSSHVLCSTAVSCVLNLPQPNQAFKTGLEDAELVVETERCGSYDDVILEGDNVLNVMDRDRDAEYVSDFDSGSYEWEEPHTLHSQEGRVILEDNIKTERTGHNSEMHSTTSSSLITCKSVKTPNAHFTVSNHTKEVIQPSSNWQSDTYFAVPEPVKRSKSNQCKASIKTSPQFQPQLHRLHQNDKTCSLSPFKSKLFVPENTSTPNTSSSRPKPNITNHTKSLKSSFTIYSEPTNHTAGSSNPSFSSLRTPNNVLSSLSTNKPSSANRCCVSLTAKGPPKITSPLCACGRRAKRQVVSNGGPNHGRGFYCCAVRRSGDRGRMEKGCDFFKWESALMRSSSVTAPAVRSSVSLCHINSTLHHFPTHRVPLRKSY
ncbi:ERI1 exoribonuclease 2 [Melanotaenia boesemani]|uniref:ERI1 exoribonuclease 2 n=1 Tax=Melanotaenia boesemani TaxID=1250792 RepID=UPI001C044A8E|nr:ERI1 exoribonuclease 2 [Melanotaenia boesemani]